MRRLFISENIITYFRRIINRIRPLYFNIFFIKIKNKSGAYADNNKSKNIDYPKYGKLYCLKNAVLTIKICQYGIARRIKRLTLNKTRKSFFLLLKLIYTSDHNSGKRGNPAPHGPCRMHSMQQDGKYPFQVHYACIQEYEALSKAL